MLVAVKETFLENNILENHNQIQLFGTDYILDKNENPYLLEINKGPNTKLYSDYEKKMKNVFIKCRFGEMILMLKDQL